MNLIKKDSSTLQEKISNNSLKIQKLLEENDKLKEKNINNYIPEDESKDKNNNKNENQAINSHESNEIK